MEPGYSRLCTRMTSVPPWSEPSAVDLVSLAAPGCSVLPLVKVTVREV